MNGIPNASEAFKYILYADDTTLFNTIQISVGAPLDINSQLAKICDWLEFNKVSLNVKKTKFVVFHAINKDIEELVPELQINNIAIERVENFNFLGLIFNEHMFWKHHIDAIANKLTTFSGISNKLKRFLLVHILRTLYFSMVQSQLTYGILAWGFEHQRFVKIQKRFIRIISLSTYSAHTEPWFKQLGILEINNLFDLNCLKFVYNYNKGGLPRYFLGLDTNKDLLFTTMIPGPVFCLLLRVISGYAQPITGQVTEVTCPVIGQAQPELTPSKRQKTGPDLLTS